MNNEIYLHLKKIEKLISKNDVDFSLIEKDIVLQLLRDLYIKLAEINPNIVETKPIVNQVINDVIPKQVQKEKRNVEDINLHKEVQKPQVVEELKLKEELQKPQVVEEVKLKEEVQKPQFVEEVKLKEEEEKPQPTINKSTEYQEIKIIGEILGKEKTSIYDKLSENNRHDISTILSEKSILDIKTAIPIGERFLYIRELFNNDSEKFNTAINRLNSCSNFNQAVNILIDEYKIDENNENLINFLNVVRKRYS